MLSAPRASCSVHLDLPATRQLLEVTTVSGLAPPIIWLAHTAALVSTLFARSEEIYFDPHFSLKQPSRALLGFLDRSTLTPAAPTQPEVPIANPQSPYILDPNRGEDDLNDIADNRDGAHDAPLADIVLVDDSLADLGPDHVVSDLIPAATGNEVEPIGSQYDVITLAAELVEARNSMNGGYN